MQNMNLLGMELKDCGAPEALNKAEGYLHNGVMSRVLCLTVPVLIQAERSAALAHFLERAELLLWGDQVTLQTVGIQDNKRLRETDNKEFLQGFLSRLAKNHEAVLVISDTQEQAETLKRELMNFQSGITIMTTLSFFDFVEHREKMINEINLISPAVIVARASYHTQMTWLEDNSALINCRIWLALPDDFSFENRKEKKLRRLLRFIRREHLKYRINKYRK